MTILVNMGAFFVTRFLANLAHADRSTAVLLGWIGALLAQGLLTKLTSVNEGPVGG